MAGEEVTYTINADDKSAAGSQSAVSNLRNIEAAAKRAGVSTTEMQRRYSTAWDRFDEERRRNIQRSTVESDKANRSQIEGLKGIAKAGESVNDELLLMAGRYVGIGAAVEGARRSFLGFADFDTTLRRMAVNSDRTLEQMKAFVPAWRGLSKEVGYSVEELAGAFDELRTSANISPEETAKIFPDIVKGAKASGAELKGLNNLFGNLMKLGGVDAGSSKRIMEMLNFGVVKYKINIKDLIENGQDLIAQQEKWGDLGEAGFARNIAAMGSLTGSTKNQASALVGIYKLMSNAHVETMLKMSSGDLARTIHANVQNGGDALGSFVELVHNRIARSKGAITTEMIFPSRSGIDLYMRNLLKAYETMDGEARKVFAANGYVAKGLELTTKGPGAAIDAFVNSLKELRDELGHLIDTLGASNFLTGLAHDIHSMVEDIERIIAILDKLSGGKNVVSKVWNAPNEFIKNIVAGLHSESLPKLEEHRAQFVAKLESGGGTEEENAKLKELIASIDETIDRLKGTNGGLFGLGKLFSKTPMAPSSTEPEASSGFSDRFGDWSKEKKKPTKAGFELPDISKIDKTAVGVKAVEYGAWGAGKAIPQLALMGTLADLITPALAIKQLYDTTHAHPPMFSGEILRQQRGGKSVNETLREEYKQRAKGDQSLLPESQVEHLGVVIGQEAGSEIVNRLKADEGAIPGTAKLRSGGWPAGVNAGMFGGGGGEGAGEPGGMPSGAGQGSGVEGMGGLGSGGGGGRTGGTRVASLPPSGEGVGRGGGGGGGEGGAGGFLKSQRARIMAELQDPAKREAFAGLLQAEGGNLSPTAKHALAESIINRWSGRGQSVQQGIASSYYGTNPRYRTPSAETRDQLPGILKEIEGGSDVSKGATGNASANVGLGFPRGDPRNQGTVQNRGERIGPEAADSAWSKQYNAASQGDGGGALASGGGLVEQAQQRVAGTRKGAIDPRLQQALDYAANQAGVKVRVTSGGQRMPGAPGATGSHRHDQGKAGDFDIVDPKTGKLLSRDDPRRLKFMEEAAAAGAGGAGAGYMSDPLKVHMGITGKESVVGKGMGAYAGNAAERAAVDRGIARSKNFKYPSTKQADTPAGDINTPGSKTETQGQFEKQSSLDLPKEHTVKVKLETDNANLQFARSSIRRQAESDMRGVRHESYSDIGVA